jgi:DNA polymerase III sliding clamp (beta) subunit (PCNA family)
MLTAICLDIRGESMTLAATDRYRLAVRELRWEPAQPDLRAVALVPARTLADAARTMAPGEPVPVAFTPARAPAAGRDPHPVEGMISFECGGRRLTGRLIGGEFIRYRSRFPDAYGCRAEMPAGPFIEAVRRVSLVADRASPVRLTFGQGQVVVEAQTEGRARAAEAVTASFEGDEPAIAFNPHYLLDGLTAAAGGPGAARQPADPEDTSAPAAAAAAVRLEFTSPAKPALITSAGDGTEEAGPRETREPEETGDSGGAGPAAEPSFRYLVVPLRSPTRA